MADEITLRFPGTADYVRLARLAAADAASRAGLDVEEIDDLRVALSELCAIVAGGEGSSTTLELTVTPRRIEISGEGTSARPSEAPEFAEALIAAVSDEYELARDGAVASFRLVKRAASPDGS